MAGKPDGAGLGLAICQRIVSLHGGAIWVEDSVEGGADFRVRIPAAVERPLEMA
jgi:signal transduction histidine kinase